MSLLSVLSEVLLPWRCACCAAPADGPLCTACVARLPRILDPVCDRCGVPSLRSACVRCRAAPPAFRRARAPFAYAGPARDALIAFKLAGERRAVRALAAEMAAAAAGTLAGDAMCFVPALPRASRARGFNPAEALARAVAPRLRIPVVPLIRKVRETADQAGLLRPARLANLRGAFRANGAPEEVLLVDDVMTTGATAEECARALQTAGARLVDVLTLARSL